MANFDKAYALTMGNEGGYANDPVDRGEETYKGISRVYNPTWSGWSIIDEAKRGLSVDQLNIKLAANGDLQTKVRTLYKIQYWNVNNLDSFISQDIANELFDTAVNMGVKVAARFLQEALNLTNANQRLYDDIVIDGNVGPITLQRVNAHPNPGIVLKVLNGLQAERYLSIMRASPAQEKFCRTWFSRVRI